MSLVHDANRQSRFRRRDSSNREGTHVRRSTTDATNEARASLEADIRE
jgi:hypothetical protein